MMTTRRGAVSRAVRVHLALAFSLVSVASSATAAAQSGAVKTTLQGDSSGCLTQRALDKRIAHYLSGTAGVVPGLQVHVRAPDVGATEFELERAGSALAVRRFDTLPKGCTDRLNAIALAIAVAVEQAAHSQAVAAVDEPPRADPVAAAAVAAAATGVGVAEARVLSHPTGPILSPPPPTPAADARPKLATDAQPKPAQPAEPKPPVAEVAPPVDPSTPSAPPAPVSEPHDAEPEIAETDGTPDGEPLVLSLSLQAGGGVVIGVLPAPALAGVVGGELSFGDIGSVRLSALMTQETRTKIATGDALVQLIGGRCLFCHRLPLAWTALHPCLGVIGGGFLAEGEGYYYENPTQLFWLAAHARLGWRLFERAPVALELGAEIYANLVQPSLRVDESDADPLVTPYVGASGGLEIIFTLF